MTSGQTWWLRPNYDRWLLTSGTAVSVDGRREPLGIQAQSAFTHASHRLADEASHFDRVDGILALKRAMRARLDHLNQSLGLDKLPIACPGGRLEKLEILGIIRRGALQRMNKLRNAVEHDGAEPPNIDECRDYLETVWYYLKVTTPYLTPPDDGQVTWIEVVDDIEYETDCFLSYDIRYRPLTIDVSLRVLPERLSTTQIEGGLELAPTPNRWHKHQGAMKPIESNGRLHFDGQIISDVSKMSFLREVFDDFL